MDLPLALDMRSVVADAVYDEPTSDTSYPKDRDVKAFIDGHKRPFVIENTDIDPKRPQNGSLRKTAGELAVVDFMTSGEGMPRSVATAEPVALFEDAGVGVFNKPPNLHCF